MRQSYLKSPVGELLLGTRRHFRNSLVSEGIMASPSPGIPSVTQQNKSVFGSDAARVRPKPLGEHDERHDHHKRAMTGPRCNTASVASRATDAIA